MEITSIHFLIHTIPESIIVVMFILFFIEKEGQWKKGLIGSIFLAIFVLISRNFLFVEMINLHTLVYAVLLIILLYHLLDNVRLNILVKVTLIATLLVFVSEILFDFVFFNILNISPDKVHSSLILLALTFVELLIFASVGLGLRFYKKQKYLRS